LSTHRRSASHARGGAIQAGPLSGATQRLLLETAPDAVVIVDARGDVVFVNAQCEALFGYDRDELVGHPVELLVPQSVRVIHPSHRANYMGEPAVRPMGAGLDLTARRKDGTEFPADIALSSLETPNGLYVSAFVRDVTEKREAQNALGKLAAIVESSSDAIVGKTVEGLVTSWNPAAAELFGWDANEAVGRSIDFLIPRSSRQEELGILNQLGRGETVATYETERMTRSGKNVLVALTGSSIRGADGEITGVSSIYRDITSEKKAEAKFEALLEAAPDAIVGVDRNGVIKLANAQAERMFGYSRSELMGKPIEILVPEGVRDLHPRHRDTYFAHPTTRPMGAGLQLAARRRDGSEFPVDIALSALEFEDEVLVSAAVRDISDRIREARERERLESQSRQTRLESIGQLAGGIAHDFNNLLAGILSYAMLVQESVVGLNEAVGEEHRNETAVEDVAQIVRATERAAALTHQLLLFGRKEIIEPQILNLNDIVAGMHDLLSRTIGEHIRLTKLLSESLRPIRMDAGHVEQILMNLAVNARDAMTSGGHLSIETAAATLDEEYARSQEISPGEYVSLAVSDTGAGMPPEVVAKAFEPYFSTKARGEGSGLGLATVYGIVAQVGGHITIYSEVGLGTTVRVYLPMVRGQVAEAQREIAKMMTPVKGETILLVEDEALVREPAARVLARSGYRVLVAADPQQALEIAGDHSVAIDLLLTDVVMPGMSGRALAERLKATRPKIRVLFMSGYSPDVITSQGVLEPGVMLLQKPFAMADLLSRVSGIIETLDG
jgi:two-component system, cell cycle sensor histidine kinase and response regulator CckA